MLTKMRIAIVPIFLISACAFFPIVTAAAGVSYTIADRGSLDPHCGGGGSPNFDINDTGQIAGGLLFTVPDGNGGCIGHAVFGSTTGGLIRLPDGSVSSAMAINNAGQVIGQNDFGTNVTQSTDPAFWQQGPNAAPLDIETAQNVNSNDALGINDGGVVVGQASVNYQQQAYMWTAANGRVSLDPPSVPGIPFTRAAANDINNENQIVGYAANNNITDCALWQSGQATVIPSPQARVACVAEAINNHGEVVGEVDEVAFIWTATTGMTSLGDVVAPLGGTAISNATGVNDAGLVVGWMYGPNIGNDGFLYKDGQATALASLLPVSSGWSHLIASRINNEGQIVGIGQYNGSDHVFVMTPQAQPPTLTKIAIIPANPGVAPGASAHLRAAATYSDNSTQDVTTSGTWLSLNTSVALVSQLGVVTGVLAGTAPISFSYSGMSTSTTLTVATPSAAPGQRPGQGAGSGTPAPPAPAGRGSSQPLLFMVAGIVGPWFAETQDCQSADARARYGFQYILSDVLKQPSYQGTPVAFNYGEYSGTGLQPPGGYAPCLPGSGQYNAADNHKTLLDSALQMEVQLENQAGSLHPSRIDILAHSQGGALSLLWAQLYGKTFDDKFHMPVNIITLDSPVMGCSSWACYAWNNAVLDVASVSDMQNSDIIERMLAARGVNTAHYSAVTTVTVYSAADGLANDPLAGDRIVTYHGAHPTDLDGKSQTIGGTRVSQVQDIDECSAWPDHGACHMSVLADSDVKAWIGRILVPSPNAIPQSGRGTSGAAGASSQSMTGTVSASVVGTPEPTHAAASPPRSPAPLPVHR